MLTWRFTLWFIFTQAVVRESIACPHNWLRFGESCFAIIESQNTWAEASEVCEQMLGYLAEIDSLMKDIFIKALAKDRHLHTPYVWLGGNDLIVEGNWVWTMSNLPINYTDWCHPKQPNDRDKQDCLALASASGCDWNWFDLPCSNRYSSVCEMKMPSSLIG